MTKKVYRTASGKEVDMGALLLQHESVRAVGNMGVNARGDVLDSNNQVIEHSTQRTSKQYSKQVSKMSKAPVNTSMPKVERSVTKEVITTEAVDEIGADIEEKPTKGFASALAKAKTNKEKLNRPTENKSK